MTIHKTLRRRDDIDGLYVSRDDIDGLYMSRDDIDGLYVSRKKEEEKSSVDASTQMFKTTLKRAKMS